VLELEKAVREIHHVYQVDVPLSPVGIQNKANPLPPPMDGEACESNRLDKAFHAGMVLSRETSPGSLMGKAVDPNVPSASWPTHTTARLDQQDAPRMREGHRCLIRKLYAEIGKERIRLGAVGPEEDCA
jgi:hypothetical protein